MKLPDRKLETPTLNLSPLIDVIFILLIFVVMVARFIDDERLDVTPPSAAAGRPAEVDALMIEVDAQGQVVIEGELIAEDYLSEVLIDARGRFKRAVLVADRDAKLQVAVDVLSTAKLSGFEGVALATTPPDP
jgi:biopolymer transport protein ExbD